MHHPHTGPHYIAPNRTVCDKCCCRFTQGYSRSPSTISTSQAEHGYATGVLISQRRLWAVVASGDVIMAVAQVDHTSTVDATTQRLSQLHARTRANCATSGTAGCEPGEESNALSMSKNPVDKCCQKVLKRLLFDRISIIFLTCAHWESCIDYFPKKILK